MPDVANQMNVREFLADKLSPLIPDGWKIVASVRNLDKPTGIVAQIKHTGVTRMPEAPIGHLQHTVTLTVLTPHTDVEKAEDALDEAVTELLTLIDAHESIGWSDATKVRADTWLAWDIDLAVISNRTTPDTPTE